MANRALAVARVLAEVRQRRALMLRRPRRRRALPKQLPPNAVILFYRSGLLALMRDAAQLVRERIMSQLDILLADAAAERGDALHQDAGGRRIKDLVEQVRGEFNRRHPLNELAQLTGEVATRTARHQKEQLQRQVRAAVGVDVLSAEPNIGPQVDSFTQKQVSLITNATSTMLSQVEERVQTAAAGGWRASDLAAELQERFQVGESRAALIARDQTLTFYANLNETRQKAMGVEDYIWQTSQDERVRPEHARRNGQRYSWDDRGQIVPGEEVNCRCTAEPVLDDLIEQLL